MCGDTNDSMKYTYKPEIKVHLYEKQFEKSFLLLEVRLFFTFFYRKCLHVCFFLNKKIEEAKEQFKKLEEIYKQRIDSTAQNNEFFSIEKNPFKDCKKYFSDLSCILDELGYYAFYLSYKKIRDKMLKAFSEFQNFRLSDIHSYLECLFNFIDEFCCQVIKEEELLGIKENSFEYSSPKVKCFLNILKEKHEADSLQTSVDTKFHAIVFVERKETALGFRDLLKKISLLDEWNFIRSEYIIGHSNLKNGEKMDCKQQVSNNRFDRVFDVNDQCVF